LGEEGGGVVVAFGAGPALSVGVAVFGLAGLVDEMGGAVGGEGGEEARPIGEAEFDEAGGAVGEKGGGVWVVFGAGEGVVGCGGVGCGDPVAAGAVAGVLSGGDHAGAVFGMVGVADGCGEEGLEFGCSGVFDGLVLVCGDVAGVVLDEEDAVGEE